MRITQSLVALIAALALWAVPSQAQTCTAGPSAPCSLNHTVRAVPATVAQLTQSAGASDFGQITAAHYNNPAGKDATAPFDLTVVANDDWDVSVATAATTWVGPAGTAKEAEDLRILVGATYQPLSTTSQSLAAGGAGTPPVILAQLNSLWDYATDPPGTYQITVVFTLSTP